MSFKLSGVLKKKSKPETKPKAKKAPQPKPEGYTVYNGVDDQFPDTLVTLYKWNPSTYIKFKLLTISAVESGSQAQAKKLASYLRGFLMPRDIKEFNLQRDLKKLQMYVNDLKDGGDAKPLLAMFKTTDRKLGL
ncbi:hypothetical protein S1R3X_000078 [Vibrio phage vB_ValS_VA-RY-4]|nr:hypothetical protein [Vibrio phage J14]QAY01930.1 hypothetical protein ValSw41_114 [Vibrio phage ValSw4_1]QQO38266.1 hypothetical protein [Vibrio phage vB_VpaS_VP-RY-9]UFD98286.1 hypothetical protein S1R3X_000078 [Vibrio phage vB_ValS_VA-RY-4]WGH28468.1 hypothetical protein 13VO501A_gene0085 [Vibrio phage 13VO501A]CAH0448240.1 hypothetical protein SM030_00107 [Vibrio phage vB_VpaS_sm030]